LSIYHTVIVLIIIIILSIIINKIKNEGINKPQHSHRFDARGPRRLAHLLFIGAAFEELFHRWSCCLTTRRIFPNPGEEEFIYRAIYEPILNEISRSLS